MRVLNQGWTLVFRGIVLLLLAIVAQATSRSAIELSIDREAAAQGVLLIKPALQDGTDLACIVDTGSPVSILDKKLARQAGKKGPRINLLLWDVPHKGRLHASPAVLANGAPLKMGGEIALISMKRIAADSGYPVKAILGMDCLTNYCVQLDFTGAKLRLLEANETHPDEWGTGYSLELLNHGQSEPGYVRSFFSPIHFVGNGPAHVLLDTGLAMDGAASENWLNEQAEQGRAIKRFSDDQRKWMFPVFAWEGRNYTNVVMIRAEGGIDGETGFMGLRFLARHLVTLNFPEKKIYLQPEREGPISSEWQASLESLAPVDGELPSDAERTLNKITHRKRPSILARWFGGALTIRKDGDPSTYHYKMKYRRSEKAWVLIRAWRADENGKLLKEYALPKVELAREK